MSLYHQIFGALILIVTGKFAAFLMCADKSAKVNGIAYCLGSKRLEGNLPSHDALRSGTNRSWSSPMTARHWKLSQIISLVFIASVFAFGIFGSLASSADPLLSDAVTARLEN